MTILQQAALSLANTEAALRRMIGEAAEQGDYASVEILAQWASALSDLGSSSRLPVESPIESSGEPEAELPVPPVASVASKPVRAAGKRRAYPTFARSGDSLIKIAWSKSTKSEYQHKSSHAVTMKLAEALATLGRNGSVVSMDMILPLKLDGTSDAPGYQVYVSLAWLRQIGAVKQNGRQGYTVKTPGKLKGIVDAAWSELPDAKRS